MHIHKAIVSMRIWILWKQAIQIGWKTAVDLSMGKTTNCKRQEMYKNLEFNTPIIYIPLFILKKWEKVWCIMGVKNIRKMLQN